MAVDSIVECVPIGVLVGLRKMGNGFRSIAKVVFVETPSSETDGQIKNDGQIIIHFLTLRGEFRTENIFE